MRENCLCPEQTKRFAGQRTSGENGGGHGVRAYGQHGQRGLHAVAVQLPLRVGPRGGVRRCHRLPPAASYSVRSPKLVRNTGCALRTCFALAAPEDVSLTGAAGSATGGGASISSLPAPQRAHFSFSGLLSNIQQLALTNLYST